MDYQENWYKRGTLPSKTYSRVEQYLRELCLLEDAPLPIPQSRIELLLEAIFTGNVSKCESPKSREEKLIWALLTGDESDIERCASRIEVLWYCLVKGLNAEELLGTEVNGKVIKDCMSRIEAYLWYLVKNGGSPLMGVEYELYDFVTTYNTISAYILKAISSGETMVNIVKYDEENNTFNIPALESKEYTVQNDGTNFTLNNVEYAHGITEKTFEGGSQTLTVIPNGYSTDGYKSAILKGCTLVNLCQDLENEISTTTGMYLTEEIPVKTNAKYMVVAKVKSSNPLSSIQYSSFFRVDNSTTGYILGGINGDITTDYTTKSFTFDTGNATTLKINLRNAYSDWGLTENIAYAKEVMLIEYQEGMENWDIPYFTGMQSVRMPVLKSTGKNLFDGVLANGSLADSTGELVVANIHKHTKNYIKVEPNIDLGIYYETNDFCGTTKIYFYDSNKKYLNLNKDVSLSSGNTSKIVRVPENNNIYYMRMRFYSSNNKDIVNPKNIVIAKTSDTIKSYEPYKSNILTVNEDVELGSVGEVKDELDLLTGKITQRTDIRPYQESDESDSEVLTDMTNTRYKLAQEVVKTVDLSIVNQDGVALDKLEYFNNGHIFIESESINPSSVTYEPNINSFKGTVNVGTVTNNVLTATDKDIMIVEGDKTDCYIPKFKGMVSCTDMCLEIENEDGSTVLSQYPVNKDVVIRKIKDIEDTFNYLTGEYTRNIGEITFDGSENWETSITSNGKFIGIVYIENGALSNIYDDKEYQWNNGYLFCKDPYLGNLNSCWLHKVDNNTTQFRLMLDGTQTLADEFKEYVTNNPITIQYALAESIVTKVDMNLTKDDMRSFEGITKFRVEKNDSMLFPNKTVVTVKTSNDTDLELLSNEISTLSLEQNDTSNTISNTSEGIESVSNGLDEINSLLE